MAEIFKIEPVTSSWFMERKHQPHRIEPAAPDSPKYQFFAIFPDNPSIAYGILKEGYDPHPIRVSDQ